MNKSQFLELLTQKLDGLPRHDIDNSIGFYAEMIDDRVEDRRIDVENQVPFERLGLEQVEARWVFEAEDEFAIGELVDARELHFHDRAEHGREGRAVVAAEPFVQGLECPHLLFADALRAFEVVGRDLFARLVRRG